MPDAWFRLVFFYFNLKSGLIREVSFGVSALLRGDLLYYIYNSSDSARHWTQDICPPISKIVLKNFIKICLIIKECSEEILIKLAIVLKIPK
jgi:hypothetical protein